MFLHYVPITLFTRQVSEVSELDLCLWVLSVPSTCLVLLGAQSKHLKIGINDLSIPLPDLSTGGILL